MTVDNASLSALIAGGAGGRTLTNAVVLGKGLTVKAGNDLTFSTGAVSLGNAANTLTIANHTTFGGIISDGSGSGAGSIDKQGAGTLTLSGANTYTGATTVSAGTLDLSPTGSITSNVTNASFFTVNGTMTGNVTNNAGAFLTGSGTITGALINNGTVNPGNSPEPSPWAPIP